LLGGCGSVVIGVGFGTERSRVRLPVGQLPSKVKIWTIYQVGRFLRHSVLCAQVNSASYPTLSWTENE